MKEEFIVAKGLKVVFSGIFDFEDLYASLKDWLELKGYGNEKETFKETKYEERLMGDSRKLDITWSAEKEFKPYLANVVEISFQVIGLQDIEVEKEGVKLKMNKGEVEIRLTGKVIKDPKDTLNSLTGFVYDKLVFKSQLEEHKLDLYNLIYSLQKEIKNYLELKNF